MNKFIEKKDTHIVIKKEDAITLITADETVQLANILEKIDNKRHENGKKTNSYLVVNRDEPYAHLVFEAIKEGELEKEESLFDKDPRFCKVCGCTQDHACAGGCYWVTDDLCSACVYSLYTCEAIVKAKDEYEMIDEYPDYLADEITSEEIADGFIAGHAAALKLGLEAEDTALNPGDKVRVYLLYQHEEILKEVVYSLDPQKE